MLKREMKKKIIQEIKLSMQKSQEDITIARL